MDIDQLKLILETVKGAPQITPGAVIFWILIAQLPIFILGGYAIYTVSRTLSRVVVDPFADTGTLFGVRGSGMAQPTSEPPADPEPGKAQSQRKLPRESGYSARG